MVANDSPPTKQHTAADARPDSRSPTRHTARRFPKACRLRQRGDFDTVFANGRRVHGSYAVLVGLSTSRSHAQVGFVTGKHVGNAVQRHRARRRLFEWSRQRYRDLPDGLLLVLVARPGLLTVAHCQLQQDLDRALDRLLRRRAND